ncbi:uncharacterized protein [Dysidea avara]|uniref:uncharacterized protein isoform X9 n=1 Tax=Dysidea avara TaxID=196820 RepID=UPI003323C5F2
MFTKGDWSCIIALGMSMLVLLYVRVVLLITYLNNCYVVGIFDDTMCVNIAHCFKLSQECTDIEQITQETLELKAKTCFKGNVSLKEQEEVAM